MENTETEHRPAVVLHRPVRLVEPHDARIEALHMFPLPSRMERMAWAKDWIKSHADELARAAFPAMDDDKQDWRTVKHRMGLFVQREWEAECVNKWAREMNATFDRHRNKYVITNPPNDQDHQSQPK